VHTTGAAEATQEPTLTQREGERRGERRGGRKKEKKDRKEREELQEKNIGHAMPMPCDQQPAQLLARPHA
jgi:hypothetical protein